MPPLPNPPTGGTMLPQPPQNPPTLADVANALDYTKRILISHYGGGATEDDVGRAAVYEAAVIAENAPLAVAPPWFAPALDAVLAPLRRVAHIAYNRQLAGGVGLPFMVVPFPNGELPTAPPHSLPALTDVGAIRALTGQQANAYLNGYNLPVAHAIADRREAIRIEIGCMADL